MDVTPGERLRFGLERVRRLVALHEELERGGRPEHDLLRAAVVLLHASLEELLRGLATIRLPASDREMLGRIPFAGGDGRKTTLTLGDLAAYRGDPVDRVITDSVGAYLERRSYNDTNDVASALAEMGLPAALLAPHAPTLQVMMSRRHNIAHQLDWEKGATAGRHEPRPIERAIVEGWARAVDEFGRSVLEHPAPATPP